MKYKNIIENTTTNKKQRGINSFVAELLEELHFESNPISCFQQYLKDIFVFTVVLHSIFGYMLLANQTMSQKLKKVVIDIRREVVFIRLLQVLLILLNSIILSCFFLTNKKYRSSPLYSISKSVISIVGFLAKLTVLISAFLLYVDFLQNIAIMLFSSILCLFQKVVFGNFSLKKQRNYQSCVHSSLIYKIMVYSNLIANSLVVKYGQLTVFCVLSLIFGIIYLSWFLQIGYQLYYQKKARWVIKLVNSATISLNLQLFILLFNSDSIKKFGYVQWSAMCLFILIFHHIYEQSERFKLNSIEHYQSRQNIKQYELILDLLMEESYQNQDQNVKVIDCIIAHQQKICQNIRCQSHKRYQNVDNGLKKIKKDYYIYKDKEILLKYYIKCIYQKVLDKNKTKKNMIDFCEFMLSQFADFSTHCWYLQQLLTHNDLSFIQKIKITKMSLVLKQRSQSFNKLLNGGRLELDQVLKVQDHYQSILYDLKQLTQSNIAIWQRVSVEHINVLNIQQSILNYRGLLVCVDHKWRQIFKCFQYLQEWRVTYLNYAFYFNNKKLNNQSSQFITRVIKRQTLKLQQNIFQKQLKITQKHFFSKQSTVLIAELADQSLIVKQVSNNFQHLTYYSEQEIQNHPVNILITSQHRQRHDQLITNWVESGGTAMQAKYKVVHTDLVRKDGSEIPCTVIFKIYINLVDYNISIKFGCLIKLKQSLVNQNQIKQDESSCFSNQAAFNQQKYKQLYSLSQQNIFIKENINETQKQTQLQKIKKYMRIFCILLFLFMLIMSFTFRQETYKLQDKQLKQQFLLDSYRSPLGLIKNYMKVFLSIGRKAMLQSEINGFTAKLVQIGTNPTTIKILSDQTVNFQAKYPPFIVSPANKGIIYNQIDIYYVIYSCITSLSSAKNINRTGNDFMNLDNYIKPSFDSMMNSTKIHLHQTLQLLMQQLRTEQTNIIITVSVIFVFVTVFFCYKIFQLKRNVDEAFKMMVKFDTRYIETILQYWKKIQIKCVKFIKNIQPTKEFQQKNQEHNSYNQSASLLVSKQEELHSESNSNNKKAMNHMQRKITQQQKQTKQKRIILLTIAISMSLIFMCSIMPYIYNIIKVEELIDFQNDGYYIMRHIPTTSVLGYAITSRYYNQLYPQDFIFYPAKFEDTLSTLHLMTLYTYSNKINENSLFYLKYKNYLFGNPCTYKPDVLITASTTMQKCLSYANSSIKNGLSSYFRVVQPKIVDYMTGKIDMNLNEMDNITAGLSIGTYYIYDMMYTWCSQFQSKLDELKKVNVILTSVSIFSFLLFYLVILQYFIISRLSRTFNLLKIIFDNMVPSEILLNQKTIKRVFAKTGIIS